MRFLSTLIGGLIGVLPGLLLIALGLGLTGGGDGMIPYGIGGIAVVLVGMIVGGVAGWRSPGWLASYPWSSAIGGLAVTAAIVGIWVAASGPPDPTLHAHDCFEVYELLGATGAQGEILDLPPLSEQELLNLSATLEGFGAEADTDEVCEQLREDLDAQSQERG